MNFIDYLKWRGDLSFDVDPLNYVDNLLLSYVSYVDIDEILTNENMSLTIKQLSNAFFKIHSFKDIKKNKSLISNAPYCLYYMAQSKRFKDVIVHHYINVIDQENVIQFAAECFDIAKDITYISFRGTDDTIIGWREDFQISYKITNAQKMSVEYLNKQIQPNHKYYIGGHSKGGNLALYSGIETADKFADNIINIFSNDGPGLASEMYDHNKFDLIKKKYIKIVPSQSVIGQLFSSNDNQLVVKANGFFLSQHDGFNWQVEGNRFLYEKSIVDAVKSFNQALDEFLNNASYQDREKLTNSLFDALDKAGLKNVSDIITKGLPMVNSLLKSMSNVDKEVVKIASKLPAILAHQTANDIKEFAIRETNELRTYALDKVDEIKRMDIKEEIESLSHKFKKRS